MIMSKISIAKEVAETAIKAESERIVHFVVKSGTVYSGKPMPQGEVRVV